MTTQLASLLPHHNTARHDLLADVVVTNSEKTNDTSPSTSDLPGKLASRVLPVSTKAQKTAKSSNGNRVSENNGVVAVGLDLLGSFVLLQLGVLCDAVCALACLLFQSLALGLGVGLDGLRLVVGGHG